MNNLQPHEHPTTEEIQAQDVKEVLSHPDIEEHVVIEVPVLEILPHEALLPAETTQTTQAETQADKGESDENGFETLGLSHALLKSLSDSGYTQPTPIQAQAIPAAMAGRDLLLSAQTGSGKTAAFVLPILDLISQSKSKSRAVRALILTPTRELAQQVSDSIRRYASHMRDLYCVPLVGGAPYTGQIRALKKGVQIIIATPGRLLDHMSDGRIDLSSLSVLVLDEADRMLDMGFSDDINRILDQTPAQRQTIMSSATWDGPVGKIAESFTKNPERINIKVESAHIDEKVYFCDDFNHKNKLLESLVCDPEMQQAIIFTATKRSSEQVAERLQEWGHKACFLHGDLPQGKRNRILADVKSGKFDIIVATDVAARGIDVPAISHVFNYDLPRQVEDYVHRIGRSGRAGRTGIAINLCSRDDRSQFHQINRYLKRDMTEATVEGLEPRFVEDRYSRDSKGGKGRSGSRGRGGYANSNGGYKGRSDSRSDNRGGRDSQRDGGQKYSGFKGDSSGYKGSYGDRKPRDERSNDRFANSANDSRPQRSERSDRSDGKMLTSHEFNFFDRKNSGRDDRNDRNERSNRHDRKSDRPRQERSQFADRPRGDRGDRPQFERNDRPRQERSFEGKSERGFDRNSDRTSDRNSDRRSDRPLSKNAQGFQDRKRQASFKETGERSSYQGEKRGGFGKSGDSYSDRRSRQDSFGSSSRDGDKPARRKSSFTGGSRRDSTGKPI